LRGHPRRGFRYRDVVETIKDVLGLALDKRFRKKMGVI